MPSNIERKARRKRQTRLTFDPVGSAPSSSPGSNMSPAKVRYELPRQNRRTPASSLQVYGDGHGEEGDSGSEDLLASGGKDYMVGSSGKEKRGKSGKQLFKPLPTPVKSSQSHFKDADRGKSGHKFIKFWAPSSPFEAVFVSLLLIDSRTQKILRATLIQIKDEDLKEISRN